MRRFLILGHDAVSTPDFSRKDLSGSGGRLDILCRAVGAALLVSHGLREDAWFYSLHLAGAQAPKVVRWEGARLRNLHPDENAVAGLYAKALGAFTTGPVWQEVAPGLSVAELTLEELLADIAAPIAWLQEDGEDLATSQTPDDVLFVLGDHKGFTPDEEGVLSRASKLRVSLGPLSLQADQAIVVAHALLDRRGGGAARPR